MGIIGPDPGQPLAAAKMYGYDATASAFSTTAGARYLYPEGAAPGRWVLTSATERTFSEETYKLLRSGEPSENNTFLSGKHRYVLSDTGTEAVAEPA